ncbi:hypothetical protein [Desulfonatronum lacustre]|uniref:hypothetical protein n=1 Tax=Desulfonatronum lacustre TaxID=66849 RepID=UPI0012EBAD10|nr:hypothetical protein [Desulfonatronum lacustre]
MASQSRMFSGVSLVLFPLSVPVLDCQGQLDRYMVEQSFAKSSSCQVLHATPYAVHFQNTKYRYLVVLQALGQPWKVYTSSAHHIFKNFSQSGLGQDFLLQIQVLICSKYTTLDVELHNGLTYCNPCGALAGGIPVRHPNEAPESQAHQGMA